MTWSADSRRFRLFGRLLRQGCGVGERRKGDLTRCVYADTSVRPERCGADFGGRAARPLQLGRSDSSARGQLMMQGIQVAICLRVPPRAMVGCLTSRICPVAVVAEQLREDRIHHWPPRLTGIISALRQCPRTAPSCLQLQFSDAFGPLQASRRKRRHDLSLRGRPSASLTENEVQFSR